MRRLQLLCLIWNQGFYGEKATSVPHIPSLGSGAFLLLLLPRLACARVREAGGPRWVRLGGEVAASQASGGDATQVSVWLPVTPAALLALPLPIFVTRALGNLPIEIKSFSFKSMFSG